MPHEKLKLPPLLLPLLLSGLLAVSCRDGAARRETAAYRGLAELDGYVAARPVYETRKQDQLESLRRLYRSAQGPEQRFDIGMYLANEYFSFHFDSTQAYLQRCLDLASHMGDKDRYNQASIRLGYLYDKAGNYMEAWNRLFTQVDTASLSEERRVEYLMALYEFSRDLAGNSGMVERPPIQDRDVYRQQLYALVPHDSRIWRELRLDELTVQGRLEEADSLAHVLIASVTPEEHKYAIYAYEMAMIAEQLGHWDERLAWLVRSAESDMRNAVKDYASLTMVAQSIVEDDLDRSFRYLRIAQEDALAYNAKLRPWQISQFFMGIEERYSARQQRLYRGLVVVLALLAVLAAALFVLSGALVNRSRKLSRFQQVLQERHLQLAAANEQLEVLNRQLARADRVKEKYLVDFLRRFSDNVSLYQSEDNRARNLLKQGKAEQLLRELSLSSRSEKGLKEFYRIFDATFLGICPDFVEQFNALLREEARFSPREGSLTTELRIFALIRLGVDDSREIASLLHYSQSTIYNYKVSVKNAALGDRDSFEDQVRMIGK